VPGDGDFADQEKAADALFGGDGEVGEDCEGDALADDALILDGGNNRYVGGTGAEGFGAL